MHFRYARHTTDLHRLQFFYCDILGLEILGDFKDHEGYDGLFIGKKGADWHIEFTLSNEPPQHKPDEDDLLVFYASSQEEYDYLIGRFAQHNIPSLRAKNPYWQLHGKTYADPDGFRIVISNRRL